MLAVRRADAVQLAARADAEQVRDRIVAEARSNPLALLELPRGLRRPNWRADSGLPPHRRWRAASKTASLQLKVLPRDTQQLLLTAAAEPVVT
jgi:hypothetical protein